MKLGVIDVGGGFRDIYGAGILDVCLEEGISFDLCIGVSAGSANLASFLAGQKGRNYKFYTEYAFRKEYASFSNWLRTKNFVDLDYVYGSLTNSDGEYPLDYDTMMADPAKFYIVCCNALTGETVYWEKSGIARDKYDPLKGSSALPMACLPYPVEGTLCYDGGIADPVPVAKAFAEGCDKVVLILTKPRDTVREQKPDRAAARRIAKRYPKASEQLLLRYKKYNEGVALAQEYERDGRLLLLAPDDCCGLSTLRKTREDIERMYQKGRRDGRAVLSFVAEERT